MEFQSIKNIIKIEHRQTYELTIKNTHCFFVNDMLKHNCRCLAFVNVDEDGAQVKFISRQDKEFTTLDNLKPAYEKFFEGMTGEWIVDGEICLVDENGNESFHGLMSEIRRKNHTIENPVHMVFDILTAEEFWTGNGRTFGERKNYMTQCFKSWTGDNIRLLEQHSCTVSSMNSLMKRVEEEGWEGLMVRRTDVKYEGKRTNNLLKIKKFHDDEYIVKDVIYGDLTYNTPEGSKNYYCVSALVIEHKGNIVKVGSGMTKEQRLDWTSSPNNIIGKTINVRYFQETQDKKTGEYSLRFPTLYHVYENGRDC